MPRRKRKPLKKLNMTMRRKLVGLLVIVLLALVGLTLRITYINASSGSSYRKQVLSQTQEQYASQTLPYKRGDIYDRNGTILATSNKVYNVVLDCGVVNADPNYVEPTIDALYSILGIDEQQVRDLLEDDETKSSPYQVIETAVPMELKKEFEDYAEPEDDEDLSAEELERRSNIKGVWFEEDYERYYPLGSVACNVIGFTVDNNLSDWGIEGYYSSTLNGVDGRSYGSYSGGSSVEQTIIEPTDGSSVVSTIDVGIQQIVEKYLDAFMNYMGAENVGVVVMDPNNGEVLAMKSQITFDLNDPYDLSAVYSEEEIAEMSEDDKTEALSEMWSNYCVSEAYEPGSVIKPINMASALESGAITEEDTFTCDGGADYGDSTYIKCTGAHGTETLEEIIANSCNDGMMQVGSRMGVDTFVAFQNRFNFGSRTGIDLPNESSGIIHSEDTMGLVDLACSAFGQGFTCTMLQEIAAMCSVVNGGYYYQPHVVSEILNNDGSVAKTITSTLMKQTISENVSEKIRSYMQASVEYGTSTNSKVEGYSSGGKTGTAEKLPRNNGNYLVSWIGFFPVDTPEVIIYVVVDEPKTDPQDNSSYAQFLAQAIMSEVLPYMNIVPDEVSEGSGVPTTDLDTPYKSVANSTEEEELADIDENTTPTGEIGEATVAGETGEATVDGETEEGVNASDSSVEETREGTDDVNIPSPLEEDSDEEDEEPGGITNEESELGL